VGIRQTLRDDASVRRALRVGGENQSVMGILLVVRLARVFMAQVGCAWVCCDEADGGRMCV
jgi:hypothetical protein